MDEGPLISRARGPCGELRIYTSGCCAGEELAPWLWVAAILPWLEVLVASGVAVLLRGTVEPGLLGTVTPGGGIGW